MSIEGQLDWTFDDDAITFEFTVTNQGSQPVDLSFPSGKRADIAVYQDEGEVWRWSTNRMFTQATTTETLPPGQALVQTFTWQDPAPGEYTAVATLSTHTPIETQIHLAL